MSHRHNLEAVDRTLRNVLLLTLPFGEIANLLIGDFRQILPVVRAASHSQKVAAFLKKSNLFWHFKGLN